MKWNESLSKATVFFDLHKITIFDTHFIQQYYVFKSLSRYVIQPDHRPPMIGDHKQNLTVIAKEWISGRTLFPAGTIR